MALIELNRVRHDGRELPALALGRRDGFEGKLARLDLAATRGLRERFTRFILRGALTRVADVRLCGRGAGTREMCCYSDCWMGFPPHPVGLE